MLDTADDYAAGDGVVMLRCTAELPYDAVFRACNDYLPDGGLHG